MTKLEREIVSKKISVIIKNEKHSWQDLKEEIANYGYQSYYPAQDAFKNLIHSLVETLDEDEKISLINEWKRDKGRIQFEMDKEYLEQYKLYIMEELIKRAAKASYYL